MSRPAPGWISPWAIYNAELDRYEISDDTKPTWIFPPPVTGTEGRIMVSPQEETIAATEDHSAGIVRGSFVYNDYGTLISSQEYKAFYARYNIRSTTPGNPTAEVTGIEGAVGSYIADEALTFRGGYFRTYTNADATSTMRTAIGCEISARASYSGGTECVAESGTAFVGARIWMAPFFTDASITNINNFHALWIVNEAAGKIITNAIKIDASTYQGGFNYSFYADDGKIYNYLDGSTGSSFAAGGSVTTSGDTLLHVVGEDYRTLTSSQEYKGAYIRYNVRSTTPSNPTAEVTGIEGAVGSYIADEALTFRGGYFRTYTNADATSTMRTAIGCEISARASYSGGTECVAESGTAFVGARIWMAPYFTDASITNINNFHALWILNEAAGKFVTNAIKIDATTYNSGFTYSFQADSGKFRLALDGSEAGSGLVAGETVTTAGDDWMYVQADDYRTLTANQTYRAAYFRNNYRSTTPSNPVFEFTGVEGVVGSYTTEEAGTFRGGHFRTYINADATSTMRTNIGCEMSARASYSGGTECVAESGTAFVGARIWMAPWFTSGSVGNVNNFWGLWIYGEHNAQRNADAAIYISDAGGGYTDAIRIAATMSGYAINISTACDAALYAVFNISAQLGAYVHGVKYEATRTANIQPATGGWFGGQFVLNAGTDSGYALINKASYAVQGVIKGDRWSSGVHVNAGRFELQSSGAAYGGIVYITANSGTTCDHLLYLATHIVPSDSMLNLNVQSSQTVTIGVKLMSGSGASFNYGIDMNSATINTADIRLGAGMNIFNDKADRTMIGNVIGICNDASPADNAPANGVVLYFDGTDLKAVNSTGATATLNNAAFT